MDCEIPKFIGRIDAKSLFWDHVVGACCSNRNSSLYGALNCLIRCLRSATPSPPAPLPQILTRLGSPVFGGEGSQSRKIGFADLCRYQCPEGER